MATRKYELMVILDPVRTDEQQAETINKIEETIQKLGGTPDGKDVWGKRRLAFEIEDRKEGYYAVLTFDGDSDSDLLKELERVIKFDEDILRHMVTHAVVGKSKGTPRATREELEAQSRREARRREREAEEAASRESREDEDDDDDDDGDDNGDDD